MIQVNSKFDVGELVQYKYSNQTAKNIDAVYEVVELNIQKCYAGTQVFLTCRPIMIHTDVFNREKRKSVVAGYKEHSEYGKYREDEMVICPDDIQNVIKNGPDNNSAQV